jgi:hypothetical protein
MWARGLRWVLKGKTSLWRSNDSSCHLICFCFCLICSPCVADLLSSQADVMNPSLLPCRFSGTVVDKGDLSPQWQGSEWKTLKVRSVWYIPFVLIICLPIYQENISALFFLEKVMKTSKFSWFVRSDGMKPQISLALRGFHHGKSSHSMPLRLP